MTTSLDPNGVVALVPAHQDAPSEELLGALGDLVGSVLVVADGMPPVALRELRRRANGKPVAALVLDTRNGKGTAVAAGLEVLVATSPAPEAVLVVDADGQHPPDAIPSFLEAGRGADLVIGDRFADLAAMPVLRRAANGIARAAVRFTTGQEVGDTQCGMRLLRGRALFEVGFPGGGYEAETIHLKRCLAAGVRVAWVPIPAIYGTETSAFRAFRDSAAVLRAALASIRYPADVPSR